MTALDFTLSSDLACVDWERLAEVFRRAPLGTREPALLRQTFSNSAVVCFVWRGDELIGAGRAISDRVNWAAIFDVVVLPEFQRCGIGRRIMDDLTNRSGAKNILLHSVPGKEDFYRKLGYRKMKTAMARVANPENSERLGYIE